MSRAIARDVIAGIRETSLIQIRRPGLCRLMEVDASPELRAGHVGTLITISQPPAVPHNNRDWLARLHRDEALQRPSSHDGIRDAIHAAPHPSASSDGQVKDDRRRETMSGIVGA